MAQSGVASRLDFLETKVFRGNGKPSLEVRMTAIEGDIGRIASSLETLVSSEKTAMDYIKTQQTKEATREADKAVLADNVKTDLVKQDKKKDRSLTVWVTAAMVFATLLVGGATIGLSIHEDHYLSRLQAISQQPVQDTVHKESTAKK